MARAIWKFRLEPRRVTHTMPCGATLLHCAVQQGAPHVWALVDPEAPVTGRDLLVYGTGHPLPPDPGVYLGTFHLPADPLVFHVFDGGEVDHA
jgi:hypothetical protein